MKNLIKNAIVIFTLIVVIFGTIGVMFYPHNAYAANPSKNLTENNPAENLPSNNNYIITFNTQARKFATKYCNSGIIKEISVDKTGKISLLHDNNVYLEKKYGVDAAFLQTLKLSINRLNQINFGKSKLIDKKSSFPPINANIFVSNWKIYFTYSDVNQFLFAAATAGPVALALELEAISTMIGGPAETIITTVLDVLGMASLGRFCYVITQAEFAHEGVYIGIEWNHGFPNIVFDVWDGGY